MAQREKRSVSLTPELAAAIDQAVAQDATSFSAWVADSAAQRLRLEAGRRGMAQWEDEHGPLTPEELADGLARARALLGPGPERSSAHQA
jgi:type II secretory pathway pseudopilin PulG